MPKITFVSKSGKHLSIHASEGESLLAAARRAGISVDAPCNGVGLCGKCKMRLISGELEASISRHITDDEFDEGWRLSCESYIQGDCTVEVPESAAAFKSGIRTADLHNPKSRQAFDDIREKLEADGYLETPNVFSAEITLDPPTLEDTAPDVDRLKNAVSAMYDGLPVIISFLALKKLSYELRKSDFTIRAVLSRKEDHVRVLDIHDPSHKFTVGGIAIDIGTTTVSALLINMETGELLAQASAGNGQIVYGADVINRIIESTRPGGQERLRKAVTEDTIVPLISELCSHAGVPANQIYRVVIAGNTTMEHLIMGLYADPIRMEPYIPSFFTMEEHQAENVIPGLNEAARIVFAPNVGSYVGGDITAGVFAGHLWNDERLTLFIDLGTNGEMVVGNNEYMLCCACSAGPAFEGGEISCGMRATNGAIEAVRIDKETMEPLLKIIGDAGEKPIGICGSGIIDLVAQLFRTKIISAVGKFIREGDRVKYDEHGMGRYILAYEHESGSGREISLNEVDIDNLIRAKGAIFSAINLLLSQLGLEINDIERIMIAGGIGSGIDFENAVRIGMLPDVPRERYEYIGNSSLAGAYGMLLSRDAENLVNDLAGTMMYVELSSEAGYMDEFISACFLPHTDRDLFPSVTE